MSHDNFSTFLPGYEGLVLTEGTAQVQGLLPGEIYEYRVKRFRNGRASAFSDVMTVNLISGIEDAFAGVRVFPNPVRDHVVIDFAGDRGLVRGEIRSLCGDLISAFSNSGSDLFDLNASGLKPGFFLLTLSEGNRRRSFRLVKIE